MKTTKIIAFTLLLMSVSVSYVNAQCIANAGNDTIVCGNTVNLHGTWSQNAGAVLSWSSTTPGVTFGNPSSENTSATVPAGQSPVAFVFTETIPPSICISSDTVLVYFNPIPPSGFTVVSPVCAGSNTVISPEFSYVNNYSYAWTISPTGIPATLNGPGPYTLLWNNPGTATITLVMTDYNNGCVSAPTTHTVEVIAQPHAEAGWNQTLCGNIADLLADTTGSGMVSGQWHCNIPSIIIIPLSPAPLYYSAFADATGAAGLFQYGSLDVWFFWTGTNSAGCTKTDSVRITFNQNPTANAGADDSICGKSYVMQATNSIQNPYSLWSCAQKPHPTSSFVFDQSSSPASGVTVSDFGCYLFVWREANSYNLACIDRDTVKICFLPVPQPEANGPYYVSGQYALLNATPTPGASGYWQTYNNNWFDASVWPGDTVSCPSCYTSPNVVYYSPVSDTTVNIFWMEFDGSCFGFDTAVVQFYPLSVSSVEQDMVFSVYPNPAHTVIFWDAELMPEYIMISSIEGKTMLIKEFSGANSVEIDALQDGIYFISMKTKKGMLRSRFIKAE
jgi:hypothetical protein